MAGPLLQVLSYEQSLLLRQAAQSQLWIGCYMHRTTQKHEARRSLRHAL